MNSCFITDTHVGVKNGNALFLDYQSDFFCNAFFPTLKKKNVKTIYHFGDFYDNRTQLSIRTIDYSRRMFLDKLEEYDMKLVIIPGNHDVFFKTNNELNSLDQILSFYDRVTICHDPTTVDLGNGAKMGLVPWMSPANEKECMEFISTATDCRFLAGHFEFAGFKMAKHIDLLSHGIDTKAFSSYDTVFSGHYHTSSKQGNIHYLGTPYELTWADCDDPKAFYIFDSTTCDVTPIYNRKKMFYKFYYSDNDIEFNATDLKDRYVRLIVSKREDAEKFDDLLTRIEQAKPFELKIIESEDTYDIEKDSEDIEDVEDTPTIMKNYIGAVDTAVDKDELYEKLYGFYVEAQKIIL